MNKTLTVFESIYGIVAVIIGVVFFSYIMYVQWLLSNWWTQSTFWSLFIVLTTICASIGKLVNVLRTKNRA